MKRLLATLLLCLAAGLAPPALARGASTRDATANAAPGADEIARQVYAAIAQGGSEAEIHQRYKKRRAVSRYSASSVSTDGTGTGENADVGGERILAYGIEVQVNADNTLDVTETIRVRAEGIQIRRGIYRDFPTRYRDRYGNGVVVGFDVLGLQRDGRPEPWFTERLSNGVRVNFGNDDFLPVPANFTYTLRYRTNRQVGFFADHDELYWNAIGTGWDFPIEQANVTVHLPQPVAPADMRAEGYTGPQGANGQDYTARLPAPGQARWTLARPLSPREGLTIVLSFPKGIITPASAQEKAVWFFKDNRGVLLGLGSWLLIFVYLLLRWIRVGRDPPAGVIIARYEPPAGHSPAALRFIRKMNNDGRCFTADIVDMAVKGLLRIQGEKKAGIVGSYIWTLERTEMESDESLPGSQAALLSKLFGNEDILPVTTANRPQFMAARLEQYKVLERACSGRMFKRNHAPVGWASLVGFATMAGAFFLSDGLGIPILIGLGMLLMVTLVTFLTLMPAPTAEGRKLLDEIAGFKLYLSVAERAELASLPGPDAPPTLDAKCYEALLPYAIALDVEDAWTRKFTDAVGVMEAQRTASNLSWYHGASMSSMAQLSGSLSGSFGASIASASSSPGGSSGGGGGGSSGGGGGGGGGGGR